MEKGKRPVHSEIASEISNQNAVLSHSGRSHISDCLHIQPALLSRGTWCARCHVVIIPTTSSKQLQMRWRCQLTPLASTIHREAMPSMSEQACASSHLYILYRPMLFPLYQALEPDSFVDNLMVRQCQNKAPLETRGCFAVI